MDRRRKGARIVASEPPEDPQSGESDSETPIVSEYNQLMTCPYCVRKVDKSGLSSHIRIKHWPKYRDRKQQDTKWRCEMCRRTFLSLDHLATHLNYAHATQMEVLKHSHYPQKKEYYYFHNKFVCVVCGETFIHQYSYEYHLEKGHTHKRTHGHLHCDTKFKSGKHFFKRDTIPLLQETRKLVVRENPAKQHIDTMDKVERFESLFDDGNK